MTVAAVAPPEALWVQIRLQNGYRYAKIEDDDGLHITAEVPLWKLTTECTSDAWGLWSADLAGILEHRSIDDGRLINRIDLETRAKRFASSAQYMFFWLETDAGEAFTLRISRRDYSISRFGQLAVGIPVGATANSRLIRVDPFYDHVRVLRQSLDTGDQQTVVEGNLIEPLFFDGSHIWVLDYPERRHLSLIDPNDGSIVLQDFVGHIDGRLRRLIGGQDAVFGLFTDWAGDPNQSGIARFALGGGLEHYMPLRGAAALGTTPDAVWVVTRKSLRPRDPVSDESLVKLDLDRLDEITRMTLRSRISIIPPS